MDSHYKINKFFVDCFNEILHNEESRLCGLANNKLSISEIHVIEAIKNAENEGDSSVGKVAKMLKITMGSLTVSVSALIKKGYVIKDKDNHDKRITTLKITELGEFINEKHKDFHKKMIESVITQLNAEQEEILCNALEKLIIYFRGDNEN